MMTVEGIKMMIDAALPGSGVEIVPNPERTALAAS
jgi:hypothetical protein